MKDKIYNWVYGENTHLPLAEFPRPLLSRLRSLALFAISILLGFLIISIITDTYMLLPVALVVALYLGWECISLFRAFQQRKVSSMLCCITEIRQSAWEKYKKAHSLILLNSEDETFAISLAGGKNALSYHVEDFINVYYNTADGIFEYDGYYRFRTLYATEPAAPPNV